MSKTKIILTADATKPIDYDAEFTEYLKKYNKLAEEEGVDTSNTDMRMLMTSFFAHKLTENLIKYGIGESDYGIEIELPKAKTKKKEK